MPCVTLGHITFHFPPLWKCRHHLHPHFYFLVFNLFFICNRICPYCLWHFFLVSNLASKFFDWYFDLLALSPFWTWQSPWVSDPISLPYTPHADINSCFSPLKHIKSNLKAFTTVWALSIIEQHFMLCSLWTSVRTQHSLLFWTL